MSSSSSSSAATFSLDHLTQSPSEQLCYVHCNFCDTVLAVSVPYTSLFKTVTVRCGHCSNLLSVNMRALHLPPAPPPPPPPSTATQQQLVHNHSNLLEEISYPPHLPPVSASPVAVTPAPQSPNQSSTVKESITLSKRGEDQQSSQQAVNRPPEKRQRVPSAYNRFIKEEIQRIKAGNPDITHREAFSAAAKNWAHFPHIHFGLMSDQGLKKSNARQQDGGDHDVTLKDGFYAAAAAAAAAASANMGVITPF